MGDIADWTNNCMQEAYPDWMPVGRRSAYGPPLKCHGCGAVGLYWQRDQGSWRIHDRATLALHVCPGKLSAATFAKVPE
jgi:hypothetical protein